jgi:YD repeat-containing protein
VPDAPGNEVARYGPVRKLFIAVVGICCLAVVAIFAGPATSGGLLLLRPAPGGVEPQGIGEDYRPKHKGGVDLATGLYTRENEDLFVPGTPAIVLRRTYLSKDHISRAFGIGATHPGEEYLIGDGQQFQWASLILAKGVRIEFKRTSPGTSLINAMYVHDGSPTEWQGAELGWTGVSWAIRKRDGSLSIYRGCGQGSVCSILQARDAAGQSIYYDRDSRGTLLKMHDGRQRSITFEHDEQGRIVRAASSTGREVRYGYDPQGRLAIATSQDGIVRKYGYTGVNELATIEEPGTSIENTYEDGRVVRQVNRYPDAEPFIFTFKYHVENTRVVRTDTTRSDGSWTQFTWGPSRLKLTETLGRTGSDPLIFAYDRDPRSNEVTAVTVTCPDRQGLPLAHKSIVRPGQEERVKNDIVQTHCHWNRWRPSERSFH